MKLPRRKFLLLAAGAAALPAAARSASAQAYPTRPVRIVVGFAAGGSTDIGARVIGQWLQERLGQSFVVENRPGAATNIATEAVARAPADGYTLLMLGPSSAINATLYEKLGFVVLRDFTPIAGFMRRVKEDGADIVVVVPGGTFGPGLSVSRAMAPTSFNRLLRLWMSQQGRGLKAGTCWEEIPTFFLTSPLLNESAVVVIVPWEGFYLRLVVATGASLQPKEGKALIIILAPII